MAGRLGCAGWGPREDTALGGEWDGEMPAGALSGVPKPPPQARASEAKCSGMLEPVSATVLGKRRRGGERQIAAHQTGFSCGADGRRGGASSENNSPRCLGPRGGRRRKSRLRPRPLAAGHAPSRPCQFQPLTCSARARGEERVPDACAKSRLL